MNKKILTAVVSATLLVSMATNVFAYGSSRPYYRNMGNGFRMTETDYNEMSEYMEDRFGYSMMDEYSYDEMQSFMDENGFMTEEGYNEMAEYMEDRFGYSMMSEYSYDEMQSFMDGNNYYRGNGYRNYGCGRFGNNRRGRY